MHNYVKACRIIIQYFTAYGGKCRQLRENRTSASPRHAHNDNAHSGTLSSTRSVTHTRVEVVPMYAHTHMHLAARPQGCYFIVRHCFQGPPDNILFLLVECLMDDGDD